VGMLAGCPHPAGVGHGHNGNCCSCPGSISFLAPLAWRTRVASQNGCFHGGIGPRAGGLPRSWQRVALPLRWRCFEGVTMELRWGFEGVTKGFKGNLPPVTVSRLSRRRDESARNQGAFRGLDAAVASQPRFRRPSFAFVHSCRSQPSSSESGEFSPPASRAHWDGNPPPFCSGIPGQGCLSYPGPSVFSPG
jgi:hypothetical protein